MVNKVTFVCFGAIAPVAPLGSAPAQRHKPMSMHVFTLLKTKLYVLLIFLSIYFSGASTNHGASIFYA